MVTSAIASVILSAKRWRNEWMNGRKGGREEVWETEAERVGRGGRNRGINGSVASAKSNWWQGNGLQQQTIAMLNSYSRVEIKQIKSAHSGRLVDFIRSQ